MACVPYGQDGPGTPGRFFFLLHRVTLAVCARAAAANVAGDRRCGAAAGHYGIPESITYCRSSSGLPQASSRRGFIFQHAARRDAVMLSRLTSPRRKHER